MNATETPTTLEDLTEAQHEHQKRAGTHARREPANIGDILDRSPHTRDLAARLADPEYQSQQRLKRAERERKQAELAKANRSAEWARLASQIGKRHASCTLSNFIAETDAQRAALAAAERFREELPQRIERGSNLLIFGPVGSGKDHFMVSLLRDAVLKANASADWASGLDLWGDVRDLIGSKGNNGSPRKEKTFIRHYSRPAVLALSDPTSEGDALTPFQRGFLQRLIDARYRECKSTWLTINVPTRDAMEAVLGAPTVDRLGQDCLAIHCAWESYRRRPLLNPHRA